MTEELFAAGRDAFTHFGAQRLQLVDQLHGAADLARDGLRQLIGWHAMQEEQRTVQRLRHRPIAVEQLVEAFFELGAALRRDRIDRSYAAARNALLRNRRDRTVFLQLANRVIERSYVDVQVALDQRALEPALDLVGVKVAPVQGAEDEESCLHSLIILL